MRIIVSLLSEQPIPNLLFIRHIGKPGDKHIFISTRQMEDNHKSECLVNVLGIRSEKGEYDVIEVEPYNPEQILRVLDALIENTGDTEWIVNVTGGTKVMSQMAYTVFSEMSNTSIFYWPVTNDKLLELFPYVKEIPINNTPLITLADYLLVHGYEFTFIKPEKSQNTAESIWDKLVLSGDASLVPAIRKAKSETYNGADKPYLTGQWFEEWLYYRVKKKYNLSDQEIALSVQLVPINAARTNTPNREIDLVYVKNHELYIWEAKVYNGSSLKSGIISRDLFKLSSLRSMLGLKANAIYAAAVNILSNPDRVNTIKDYCLTLNIMEVLDISSLKTL